VTAAVTAPEPARTRALPLTVQARPAGQHASADLPPEPESAARARRLTRDALTRWHLDAITDDAQTITSELTANAISAAIPQHVTRPCIILTLHNQPAGLRITIWDNGPGHPDLATADDDAEAGRGLAIIDALTGHQWGWWPTPESGGKVTWAVLPKPPAHHHALTA
jgi:serine/threonine-protein kinase RsbW